jgi:hypothetical protein
MYARFAAALLFVLSIVGWDTKGFAGERIAEIPRNDMDRLHSLIRPQPGESPWREIQWMTNVTEARRRAILEDKPLVIFTAADGSPLGRT